MGYFFWEKKRWERKKNEKENMLGKKILKKMGFCQFVCLLFFLVWVYVLKQFPSPKTNRVYVLGSTF